MRVAVQQQGEHCGGKRRLDVERVRRDGPHRVGEFVGCRLLTLGCPQSIHSGVLERLYIHTLQAFVLAREDQQLRNPLVGYVTLNAASRGQPGTSGPDFVDYLRQRLPAYMVPAMVVVLDGFPLTPHQKVDRRALLQAATHDVAVTRALSATEAALLALWQELLGNTAMGVTDDFFRLGGSSLLAIRISSRVEAMYQVRLPVAALFECPTVQTLARLVDTLRQTPSATALPVARVQEASLPLSGAQYRLWYLQQLDPASTAYHLPDLLQLQGTLDHAALQQALAWTVQEHESLRTTFVIAGDQALQRINPPLAPALPIHALPASDATRALHQLVARMMAQPFDLASGPLARFALVKLTADTHILVSMFHHIIMDGWSVGLFQRSVAQHYNAARAGATQSRALLSGPDRNLQYRDFSAWHQALLASGEKTRQLDYWLAQLGDELPTLQLPTDFNRPQTLSGQGGTLAFELAPELSASLTALGQQHNVSMFMLLLAAYATLLARYARQHSLLIGIPTLGRARPEWEGVIGFFVNTLVIRVQADPAMRFADLLAHVRSTCLQAFEHQDIALEDIAAGVSARREQDGRGLFQTMFSYQEADALSVPQFDGLASSAIEPEHHTAKFDLYLALWAQGQRIQGGFEYSTDLFEAASISRMATHFQTLLAGIVANPACAVRALPVLTAAEYAHQITHLNQSSQPLPAQPYVRDVFAQQAALHAGRIAASCGNTALSYAELDHAANSVAHNLLAEGARGEDLIGLMLGRNLNYLVAMLGVLKAGLAFTPLNPEDPAHKLAKVIEIGKVRYLISEASTQAHASVLGTPVLALDALLQPSTHKADFLPLTPASLAYVIYTSGSTGLPKGAMIEQKGMLNHLFAKIADLQITGQDVIAEMAVTTFDVSVWQYLLALLVGGKTVVLPGDAAWEPQQLLSALEAEGVTVFESVPSHMKIIIDELEARPGHYALDQLRVYISNAEALTPALCARWFACLPHIPVVNTYGATECSDDTSHLHINANMDARFPYVPIQGTLPNLTTYLLDEQLQPVPLGVTGEVYIGGVGVGRGYLNEPVRTANAFVPDPFSTAPGRRMYKTGDLARYRPGDTLEFLGREDFQVKIRGQRVEIGEVEQAIGQHDNVRQVVVVAAKDSKGRLYLLAYVIPHRHPGPHGAGAAHVCG